MREKLTQLFTPSTERFYNFPYHKITPSELRQLIDEAPESVLLDQKFQEKIFNSIQYSFQYSGEIDVSGWLTAVNGLVARNVHEDDITQRLKEIVLKELEYTSGFGDIKKFEKIKNIFRPILEQTIAGQGEVFEHNLLLELGRFRDNQDRFKKYVAELRRVVPHIFSSEGITKIVHDVIMPDLGKYYIEAPIMIIHLSGYITEIPELQMFAADCVDQIHLVIQRNCLSLAHHYDKPWQEIFGASVADMGFEQEVNTAIINREFEDIDIEPARISKLVTFFGLEQLTPGNAAELETVCDALSRINLLPDKNTKAELLKYTQLFGVTGEMILNAPRLLDRWSRIIATNLDTSETPLDDFNQTIAELGVEGIGKQKIGMPVGFKLIERGNYGKAAALHRSLGLSYVGESVDHELTSKMQSETLAMVYKILSSDDTTYVKISDFVTFESATGILHEEMFKQLILPNLKQLSEKKVFELCRDVTEPATFNSSATEFCRELVGMIAQDAELSARIQDATSGDFWQNDNTQTIKKFLSAGVLHESYIYTSVREIAVSRFVTELTRGYLDEEVRTIFALTEQDVSVENFREAASLGVQYKITGTGGVYETVAATDRVEGAYAFAETCGIGGKELVTVVRKALIKCIASDDFTTFTHIVTAHGLQVETCVADPEFRQAAHKCLAKKIADDPEDAFRFIREFELDTERSAMHESIYRAWSTRDSVMAAVVVTFPTYVLDRTFGEFAMKAAVASKSVSFESALILNNYYTPPIDSLLYRTERVFGAYVGWKEYDYLHELVVKKTIPDELAELGVSRSGEAGVEQLKNLMYDFQCRIITDEVTSTELGTSSMLLGYYMDKTRVKVTEWGKVNAGDVVTKIRTSEQHHQAHPDTTFTDRYAPSEILKVGTTKELKDFVFDEDFVNRYRVLTSAILKAANDCDPLTMPLSKKVSEIEFCKDQIVVTLETKLADEPREALTLRARKEASKKGVAVSEVLTQLLLMRNTQLQQSITTLSSLSIRSVRDVQTNFVELARYKEFHALLLEMVFTFVFMQREHRGEVGNENDNGLSTSAEYAVAKRDPTLDGITWSLNFIDHIVNKEVMAKYFTDKEAAKALRQITSVVALEKQLAKMTTSADDKKTSLQFVPTRGALLEFSGQIGDACWASKYDCIAAKFPNFTAVTMVEKPGTESEKLAGSALLIETVSDTGTPLLVIRGLNPLETVINKLQVEDFYEKFTTWANEQAVKMGRTLAIVIDNHSGGSSTNRPVLFQYLAKKTKVLKKVTLANEPITEFNGYDIRTETYLVYNQ